MKKSMNEYNNYGRDEFNDLSSEGKLGKRLSFKQDKSSSESSNISQLSSSIVSSVSAIGTSLVTVGVVLAVVVNNVLANNQIAVENWDISTESIRFDFIDDESESSFLIELIDLESGRLNQKMTVSDSALIEFDSLLAQHEYQLDISRVVGEDLNKVKSYQISTSGLPIYPRSSVKIIDHEVDIENMILSFDVLVTDEGHYLGDYKVLISDSASTITLSDVDIKQRISLSIESFNRGFLTINIYAKSSYPLDENSEIKTTSYKVVY